MPDRAVAVLGEDQLGAARVLGVLVVVVVAVEEADEVGVLLDRAGLAQVGEDRALVGRCSGARESCEMPITGTFSSRARIFRPRLNCDTCSTRLARASSLRISWR